MLGAIRHPGETAAVETGATPIRRPLWLGPAFVALALIALVWGTVGITSRVERDAAESSAVRHAHNLAQVLEAHLTRSLREIDRSLLIVRRSYMLYPDGFDFKDWIHGGLLADEQVVQLSVIGADGMLKLTSIDPAPANPIDVKDREHFRFFAEGGRDQLLISKPVVGRASGRASVQFARRIDNPDGSFGGVLVASVDPGYFARFYGSVNVGAKGRIRVVGLDGITRSVGSQIPEPIGLDLTGRTLMQEVEKSSVGWFYSRVGIHDGVRRLVTYRVLQDVPLMLTIASAVDELFADVATKRRWYVSIAAALSALILLVLAMVIGNRRALDRAAEKVRRHNLQRDAALAHMSQGLSLFDRDGRLVICNNQYTQLYKIEPDEIRPGCTLAELLALRQARNQFSGDIPTHVAELQARLAVGVSFTLTSQLDDGRTVVVVNCPLPDGGWVATHEDVTRKRQAEFELDSTKRFLHSIIENIPLAVMVKDPHQLRYTLVNRAAEVLLGLPRSDILGRRASDFWPPQQAEAIAVRDRAVLARAEQGEIVGTNAVKTPDGVERMITARRLVVRDQQSEPQHLIAVIEDVTAREQAEARIVYMANHDPLTGLANRTLFGQSLERALAEISSEHPVALLFIDLDRFKEINDTQGHVLGDKLLKGVADRLRTCAGENDVIARLGGDEFALIMADAGKSRNPATLAAQIQRLLELPFDIEGYSARIGASIGIAMAPTDAVESTELLKRADIALYRAKAEGRNTFRFFEREMDERLKTRRSLEADLREAVEASAFELFYQPILDARQNDIVGLEALLRWRHPQRGMVSPAEFIPLAEETGLIVTIGEWVIRQALSDATRWPSHVRIAINLSPVQFSSHSLVPTLTSALATSRVAPERVELEITEQILLRDDRDNLAILEQLRGLGMRIVMDDFGTGYSSLSYLHRFAFDKIKIDRSFVVGLSDGNDVSLAIIETVASLAETIRVPTVAEGIETQAQLDLIRELGCSEYQGYLFSRPLPAAEVERSFFPDLAKASAA